MLAQARDVVALQHVENRIEDLFLFRAIGAYIREAQIAEARDATPAQVLLAWGIGRGTSVIPKSVNPGRLRENLAADELRLSAAEMQAIDALDRARRYISGEFWAMEGSPYTVDALWND